MGVKRTHRGPTTYSEQAVLNLSTDSDVDSTPLSIRGGLGWVDEEKTKWGWYKQPYMGIAPREEMEWAGDNMKYHGFNDRYNAIADDTDWVIVFAIYDVNGFFLRHQVRIGSWTLRDNITWEVS